MKSEVIKILENSGMKVRFGSFKRKNKFGRNVILSTISILKKSGKDIHKVIGKGNLSLENLKMKIVRDRRLDKEVVSLCLSVVGMKPMMIPLGVNRNYGVRYK